MSTVPEPVGSRVALLEPALLARLERSQLGTRRRLAGQLAGEHRSPLRGSSLEFSDFRPYAPGDDVRRIDPHVYARLDQLLVKLFEAEDDLTVRLLVDTSASMGHGGKLLAAKRLAAALGFVALVRRDSVSVHTVPASGRGLAGRTFRGRHAAWALFEQLALLEARGATAFVAAAGQLLARPGPPGLTVVVSDLLTPDWRDGLRRLPARGADLAIVHVLASTDLRPDVVGDVDLVDSETGRRLAASLAPAVLDRFERVAQAWREEVAGRCRSAGAAHVPFLVGDELEATLLGAAHRTGVLR